MPVTDMRNWRLIYRDRVTIRLMRQAACLA
jgi:hypothetical protein